jgi:NAD dependent epimerase/dehydratase family enzyme
MAQELVLANQEVVPKIALNGGFAYRHPHLEAALHDLLGRP